MSLSWSFMLRVLPSIGISALYKAKQGSIDAPPNDPRIHVARSRHIILVERGRSASRASIIYGISSGGGVGKRLPERCSTLLSGLNRTQAWSWAGGTAH